jgi:hypothetical protein
MKAFFKKNFKSLVGCSLLSIALVVVSFNFEYGQKYRGLPLANMTLSDSGFTAGMYLWNPFYTIINFGIYFFILYFLFIVLTAKSSSQQIQ